MVAKFMNWGYFYSIRISQNLIEGGCGQDYPHPPTPTKVGKQINVLCEGA